jgi:hypothetical protein
VHATVHNVAVCDALHHVLHVSDAARSEIIGRYLFFLNWSVREESENFFGGLIFKKTTNNSKNSFFEWRVQELGSLEDVGKDLKRDVARVDLDLLLLLFGRGHRLSSRVFSLSLSFFAKGVPSCSLLLLLGSPGCLAECVHECSCVEKPFFLFFLFPLSF